MTRKNSRPSTIDSAPTTAAEGPLSYLLMRAAKAHKAHAAVLLREIGLYPGQELLLMQLWDRDGQTQTDLVRALRLDPSTVTRMVGRLEEQGVVSRVASPRDGRAVIISLTPHGRDLQGDVRRIWADLEQTAIARMTERQRSEFLDGLELIVTALDGTGGDGGHAAAAATVVFVSEPDLGVAITPEAPPGMRTLDTQIEEWDG